VATSTRNRRPDVRPLFPTVLRSGHVTKPGAEPGRRARESFKTGLERTVRCCLTDVWAGRPLRERRHAGERLGLGPAAAKVAA
jgi:hypothetical protein